MLEFIKMFGLGILYTIIFPVLVVVFALFLVYELFNYLVIEAKVLIGFFFGYSFSVETELERKLKDAKLLVASKQNEDIRDETEVNNDELC